jgi:hypothetical protein
LIRPLKDFIKRQLNEHGFCNIRDGNGLAKCGFHDIRGVGEITAIEEYKERAFAICRRSRLQTRAEVNALKKKYEQPIFGEIAVERLLELQAQIIDPTNTLLFAGSQLTHTLQVMDSMEKAGITDREFLATTLVHDLGKLASLKGEKWENVEGGGKIPQGENAPGSGFENCNFNWDHPDVVHARFHLMCPKTWLGC